MRILSLKYGEGLMHYPGLSLEGVDEGGECSATMYTPSSKSQQWLVQLS